MSDTCFLSLKVSDSCFQFLLWHLFLLFDSFFFFFQKPVCNFLTVVFCTRLYWNVFIIFFWKLKMCSYDRIIQVKDTFTVFFFYNIKNRKFKRNVTFQKSQKKSGHDAFHFFISPLLFMLCLNFLFYVVGKKKSGHTRMHSIFMGFGECLICWKSFFKVRSTMFIFSMGMVLFSFYFFILSIDHERKNNLTQLCIFHMLYLPFY